MTQTDILSMDILSPRMFCPHGCFVRRTFCPTDVLSPRMFCPTDVLSLRTLCPHGRFVLTDVLSTDVLSPDVLSLDVLSPDVLSGHRWHTYTEFRAWILYYPESPSPGPVISLIGSHSSSSSSSSSKTLFFIIPREGVSWLLFQAVTLPVFS
jgi:hypothetical protein